MNVTLTDADGTRLPHPLPAGADVPDVSNLNVARAETAADLAVVRPATLRPGERGS